MNKKSIVSRVSEAVRGQPVDDTTLHELVACMQGMVTRKTVNYPDNVVQFLNDLGVYIKRMTGEDVSAYNVKIPTFRTGKKEASEFIGMWDDLKYELNKNVYPKAWLSRMDRTRSSVLALV